MNVTFLIGNGFDVGIGLRSKFSDFFPLYCKKADGIDSKDKDKWGLADEFKKDEILWANFEKQLGVYTGNFTEDTQNRFIEQKKNFENEFLKYLEIEELSLDFDNKNAISKKMIDALSMYYIGDNFVQSSCVKLKKVYKLHEKEKIKYNFINFNYTNVLEKCLGMIPDKIISKRNIEGNEITDVISKIIYVHGKIHDKPIMGVNDKEQIENEKLKNDSRFLKRIIKSQANDAVGRMNNSEVEQIIQISNIICIYGMSIGVTDKKWWEIILSWLSKDSTRQLVIFDYDEKFNESDMYERLEKDESIIDKLQAYVLNKYIYLEDYKDRIHIAVHKNIFQMDLRRKEANFFELMDMY